MNLENWKDINGYEGFYQISDHGNVKSLIKEGRILNACVASGYKMVNLYRDSIGKSVSVHRLVAEAFISNPNSLPQVNHMDGNKLNNHVSNLEWCTPSHNNLHKFKMGLAEAVRQRALSRVPELSKYLVEGNNKRKRKVIQLSIDGEFVREFDSVREARKTPGFGNVDRALKGLTNTAGGYLWKYK